MCETLGELPDFTEVIMFCIKYKYRLSKLYDEFKCFHNSVLTKKVEIKKIKTACLSSVFPVGRSN